MTRFRLPRDTAEDSYNLLPALQGTATRPIRNAIVHHSNDGVFSIREGSWKLILGLGSGGFSSPRKFDPTPDGPEPGGVTVTDVETELLL